MADPVSHSSSSPTRRERVRAYKQAFPPFGIHAVRSKASGRVWLGASRNVDAALNRIRFELQMRCHRDRALADEWALHGPANFTFEVLERVKERDDPAFDYESELRTLLALWQAELAPAMTGGRP